MKLDNSVTIKLSSYKDDNNNVIKPDPLVLNELNIIYIDDPKNRVYQCQIMDLGNNGSIILYTDEEYDSWGGINKILGEKKLKELFGSNPQEYLQSLIPRTLEDDPTGPGTILSSMLATIGIKSTANCSCRRHALEMNAKGPEWCERNMATILDWLRRESEKRKLPFVESLAKMLVKRAIRQSRAASNEKQLN